MNIYDLSAWCKISFTLYSNPLYNGAKLYLNGRELTDIIIPSDITEIKAQTFENCTSLTKVIIPESVTTIGYSAFSGCTSLTSVTIPDSVTLIGNVAFSGCTSLTSVTIPDSVTSIEDLAFYNCTSMAEVYCKPAIPPTGKYVTSIFHCDGGMYLIPIGCKIYVPRNSVDLYKKQWKDYASDIEGYDF